MSSIWPRIHVSKTLIPVFCFISLWGKRPQIVRLFLCLVVFLGYLKWIEISVILLSSWYFMSLTRSLLPLASSLSTHSPGDAWGRCAVLDISWEIISKKLDTTQGRGWCWSLNVGGVPWRSVYAVSGVSLGSSGRSQITARDLML